MFTDLLHHVQRSRRVRADRSILRRMSAAQLRDIGITRDQIEAYLAGITPQRTPPPRPRLVWDAQPDRQHDPRPDPQTVPCCEAA